MQLRRYGYDILSNDEEGICFYENPWIYLRQRVNEQTLDLCFKYFLWNDDEKNFLSKYIKQKNYIVMGNPRVDIWRSEKILEIYKNDIKYIRSKYKNFSLITTNFGFPHANGENFLLNQAINMNLLNDNADIWYFGKILEEKRIESTKFLRCLHHLLSMNCNKQYVLRPHPSENLKEWTAISKSYSNLSIEYNNTVTPWILSAENIYTGIQCGTGFESMLIGKNTYEMEGLDNEDKFKKYRNIHKSDVPHDFCEKFTDFVINNFEFRESKIGNIKSVKCTTEYEKQKWPGFNLKNICQKAQLLNEIFNIGLESINIVQISNNTIRITNNKK